jgi:peptidyl-prolyl cis-trans isomerase SurA
MIPSLFRRLFISVCCLCSMSGLTAAASSPPRTADYILAIVNRELVTAAELAQRIEQTREQAQRSGARAPSPDSLREPLLSALIDERVQISHAREVGPRIDDNELERAITNIASQNQLSLTELRERLVSDGLDYQRFRSNIKDQLLLERVREREVRSRITITDAEIDAWLAAQPAAANPPKTARPAQFNVAQIFISIPEGASDQTVAERQAKAQALLSRVRAGEPFERVAKADSEDLHKDQGGAIGLRTLERLPDPFSLAIRDLPEGDIAPKLVRTSAGFHVLKLLERQQYSGASIPQTKVSHLLLRTSERTSPEAALRQMRSLQKQIKGDPQKFERLAREHSEDASADKGGDLGWVNPGSFVPEFETAMNALPLGGISEPVVSRFGVHLIHVTERRDKFLGHKQQREQAKTALREQKTETATAEWIRELRALAYVELREAP